MPVDAAFYKKISEELLRRNTTLVAVSKTKPIEEILELYQLGQRDFGENYVQELSEKNEHLPKDIRWHFIGHLQSNKVKNIVPFASLIQGVDSKKLLEEINKQGKKLNKVIDCLLQVHISDEETKFGFDEKELAELFYDKNSNTQNLPDLKNVRICGLMGMASFTNDMKKVRNEFKALKSLFDKYSMLKPVKFKSQFSILSMGMSADYNIAIEEGSNMVRIGSLLFGHR